MRSAGMAQACYGYDARMLGTAKERRHAQPPATAEALADITLPDQDGNEVRLRDLWRDGPVALVWLRHYG